MLRRFVCLLLACFFPFAALTEGTAAIYRGKMQGEMHMRPEPTLDSRQLKKVPHKGIVEILEYGPEYCLCRYEGQEGYILTSMIIELWRLGDQQLPGYQTMTGIVRMTQEVFASNAEYTVGAALQPGDVISAMDENGTLPMYRSTFRLPEGSFTYEPFVSAEASAPGDLIGAFSSWYHGTPSDKLYKNRIFNIELGISRVNGITLQSGEQFSFNTVCGPYSPKGGYRNGPAINQTGEGYGGGVCQVSTTLHEAILGLWGVRLDNWEVHRYTGVRYAPLNFDACVSNVLDYCFTNTYDFPITFRMDCRGGVMTVLVYHGTAEDAPELAF